MSVAARQSAVSKPALTSLVVADKLDHRLDSDDESLAEYMGQLSRMHTTANQVSSVLSLKVKDQTFC